MAAAEDSTSLFFVSILVKALGAAAAGPGALDAFSFSASGPEFTDLADPVFGFFVGGALSSPSSSLKHKTFVIIGIKKASNEQ